jgi:hypothetical protein
MTNTSDGTLSNFLRFLCGIVVAVRPSVCVRRFEIIIGMCDALEIYTIERYVTT